MADHKKVTYDSVKNWVSSLTYLSPSRVDSGYVQFGIACGYVTTTEIVFVHEEITAVVTAKGNVEFYNSNQCLLAAISVPVEETGAARYEDICCKVDSGKIMLRFPLYTWYDNYPNCNGESDRWDAKIVGYQSPILFDIQTYEYRFAEQSF